MTTAEITDGGPAFPVDHGASFGLSIRDYFAGQALLGLVYLIGAEESSRTKPLAYRAKTAYEYADAMIAERQKGRPK